MNEVSSTNIYVNLSSNKNIKNKARRILYTNNGSNINNNNVGNLIIEIAGRINKGNNKNEIREALLDLGDFLKQYNKNLKERLSTKFGRYGNNKTTKITKKALAIAIRLKEINEKNERIGNINGNNTEIGENNINNKNNTLPTRAQLLYYIIVYILRILKLKQTSSPPPPTPPPTPESPPPSNQGNNNWGSNFNIHIINVIEAIEKFRKEKHSSGLVGKLRGKVKNARMNEASDVEKIKELLEEMVKKNKVINVSKIYEKIENLFDSLTNNEKGSLSGFIQNLYEKHCESLKKVRNYKPEIILQRLKKIQQKAAEAAVKIRNM